MQRNLEKSVSPSFNFFNKVRSRRKLTISEFTVGVLIMASVLYGFSYRSDQRQLETNAESVSVIKSSLLSDNYRQVLSKIENVEFYNNAERMKQQIWKNFAVPVHFAYLRSDSAEIGFTYNGENYTANINQDREGNSLYLPSRGYFIAKNNDTPYIIKAK